MIFNHVVPFFYSVFQVRYGLRVAVLSMAAPSILRTPRALAVVGPQAFGYPEDEVTYVPFGECKEYEPVGPR